MNDDAGVRQLWVATLTQAILDAQGNTASRCYPEGCVRTARAGLASGDPSLALALVAADLDEDWWRLRALPALRARSGAKVRSL